MEIFQHVLQLLETGQPGVLLTILDGSSIFKNLSRRHGVWVRHDQQTDDLITNVAKIENLIPTDFDTVMQQRWYQELVQLSEQTLRKGRFVRQKLTLADQWIDLMLEPIISKPRLIILGGGHVGQALAKLASIVELATVVVDDRPAFANTQIYPKGTEVICDGFVQAIHNVSPESKDFVVIVTRGHSYDRLCLETLAGTELAYIGMIGSKRRVRDLLADMIQSGVDSEWLKGLHSPIGLDIGAETPAEIAVSIMAEIIQVWREGNV